MATVYHELLNIKDLVALKAATDSYIAAQYEAARLEIMRKGAVVAQLIALDNAFAALKTAEKRAEYIVAQEAKTPIPAVNPNTIVYVVDSKHVPALKTAYAQFFQEKGYKDHPDTRNLRPKEFSFATREQFESSELYKKVSTADRTYILNYGFPCEIIGFPFKNEQDADKFRNDIMAKGLIQTAQSTSAPRAGC